jgi:hypothetical protein
VQNRINQLGLQGQVVVDSNCTSSVLDVSTFVAIEPISIAPVPAQNSLEITVQNEVIINSIEIYNNLGQLVQSELGSYSTLDVSRLSRGSYFIKINTQEDSFVKQFLKE